MIDTLITLADRTQTIKQWSAELGISTRCIRRRLERHPVDVALLTGHYAKRHPKRPDPRVAEFFSTPHASNPIMHSSRTETGYKERALPPLSTPGLSPQERNIVKLAGTLRDPDLAEMLGLSVVHVKTVLRNARLKYRDYCDQDRLRA